MVYYLLNIAAQNAYISDWFRGKELAFALGLNITISRTGSVLSFIFSSRIFEWTKSLSFSFWASTLLLSISLLLVTIVILLDQSLQKRAHYYPDQILSRKIKLNDLKKLNARFWMIVMTVIGYYMAFLSFLNIAPAFAMDQFGFTNEMAGLASVYFHII